MRIMLSGNEAIARGAWEAGVTVAAGYPGTPSTEIMEAMATYEGVYCEWSTNEKVALEVAAGASMAGARCIVTMKHVGLNVAADPLMTLAYIGPVGGLLICVADDPGMHSSQTEQDTRQYARLARCPILEPSDAAEAREMAIFGLELSERHTTPVILRSTTRISHSCGPLLTGPRSLPKRPIGFEKNPPRYVPIPVWGRPMRQRLEERIDVMAAEAAECRFNRMERRGAHLGIVTASAAYGYVKEVFPDASILKLGWSYPFPDQLIRQFARSVDQILVVEEQDPFLEEHIRSLGITAVGKAIVPRVGELTPGRLMQVRARLEGRERTLPEPVAEARDLPPRPPVLCPGCPHRGMFAALGKFDVVVTGDIGCYSLAAFPPLNRTDTILCMGAGITMAHGMERAGETRPVVGVVGDSTFFHSGVTGLLDIAYNKGRCNVMVLDNRTTAMTGHQDHPGTGRTLQGDATMDASIEQVAAACGFTHIQTVDPYDMKAVTAAIREAIHTDAPSLIVSHAPCPLKERTRLGPARQVDAERCKDCGLCLRVGCPAIEHSAGPPSINAALCTGCGLCAQACRHGAIVEWAEVTE